jgi:hypothetical protein
VNNPPSVIDLTRNSQSDFNRIYNKKKYCIQKRKKTRRRKQQNNKNERIIARQEKKSSLETFTLFSSAANLFAGN